MSGNGLKGKLVFAPKTNCYILSISANILSVGMEKRIENVFRSNGGVVNMSYAVKRGILTIRNGGRALCKDEWEWIEGKIKEME